MPPKGSGARSHGWGVCAVAGCSTPNYARGWCTKHYRRWQKYGDPAAYVRPQARPGESNKSIAVNGKKVDRHRWLWEQHHGPIPDGLVVHHINGDHYDNRIENLMLLTLSEHMRLHNRKWFACKVSGCPETKLTDGAHGFCKRHHWQLKTHGRILSVLPLRVRRVQPQTSLPLPPAPAN